DGDTWTLGMNLGLPIGQGFINVTGEYRDRDTVNRAGYDLRPNYNVVNGMFDTRELTFNRLNFQLGDPKTEDWNVVVNAGVPLGGSWEAYAFGTFSQRAGRSAANWRQGGGSTNRDFSVLSPATRPTSANFVPIYANGFLPFIASDYTDYSMALGVKGDAGEWSIDLSAVYGRNQIDYRTENSINVSYGPTGPRNVDAGGITFGQLTTNLDIAREFAIGLPKPLTLAFGAEFRRENFRERPGQIESYAVGPYYVAPRATSAADCGTLRGVYSATGICSFPGRAAAVGQQGFGGIPASARTDNSRNSVAGYVELDTDLFRGFTTTAAGRFEYYSDFGSTVNGKFAARYEFIPQLAVRGAISNGFRAPSLHQQYFTTTSTNFINGAPVDIVTAQVGSPVARALGATPLKPEKSLNVSAGITVNPLRGFNLTADFFHIRIKDRIVLTENLGASGTGTLAQRNAVQAVLDANGFSSVGAVRFFINGLDTTTKGVDVVGSYHFNAGGAGTWTLSAAYNYTDNRIDKRLNNLGPLATIPGLVLFGRVEGLRFEEGQPRDKVVLSANGEIGVFGLTARTTRYGKVVAPGAVEPLADKASLTLYGPDDIFLKPKWITDIEVRYTFKEHMTFSIGADNVFDVYPTRNPWGRRPDGGKYPDNQGYIAYSGFSPFGFNGRYIYGRFTAQF
ncbi:MAG: TonB-dependent receptor, partial [Sphingomonas sp.]|nr:TonB-dependent receptor [Sphingomonas sp.]